MLISAHDAGHTKPRPGTSRQRHSSTAEQMRARLVTLVLAVTVLPGCSGAEPDLEQPEETLETIAPEPASQTPTPEEALLKYFEASLEGSSTVAILAFQEAVARCMNDKGFEYTPDLASTTADPNVPDTQNEEWYSTWGFGISIDSSEAYAAAEMEPPAFDPNAEYLASMSEEGRVAYNQALEGQPATAAQATEEGHVDLGCYVEAGTEAYTAGDPPALIQQLQDEIAAILPERVASDPRTRDAAEHVVDCVVQAGGSPYDPLAGESAYEQVAKSYELLADTIPSDAELAEFQRWERAIAVAEFGCSQAAVQAAEAVRRDVVREVVAPNLGELQALKDEWPGPD